MSAPHVSLATVRAILGLTLEDLAREVTVVSGVPTSRGTLSAIENGERGASKEMIADLESALDLPAGAITTSYEPRQRRRRRPTT